MVGKFGIAASYAVFYVFVGELLPTVLRSQAMGIASFIAGIGLLGFPYIVYLVSEMTDRLQQWFLQDRRVPEIRFYNDGFYYEHQPKK